MDKLIEAIKAGNDEELINTLACGELITSGGRCNWKAMDELEKLLPGCEVVCLERDSFGWLIGGIKYQGKTYSYG